MSDSKILSWGDDGFASVSGWAFVHCIDEVTGEYLYSHDVWISVGTSLPSGAFLDAPPANEQGKAIVRLDGSWVLVDDFRGVTAYNKHTKQSEVIDALGPLSHEFTITPPTSRFDVWNEESGCWVKDMQAEHASLTLLATHQRSALLSEASNVIAALLDALDPAVISGPHDSVQVKLLEWKQYRAALAVLDCSIHPVQWPAKPV